MDGPLVVWVMLPLVGSVIGYLTNRIAVKMIFRPLKPVGILGIRLQGLVPRRQQEIATRIGAVVGAHLVGHDDLMRGLSKVDLHGMIGELLDEGLGSRLQQLRSLPLVGSILTDDRIHDLREGLIAGVLAHKQQLFDKLEQALEAGLDVPALVTRKVAAFPVEKLESMVVQVAARELRAIELLGALLGLVIGIGQAALLALVG